MNRLVRLSLVLLLLVAAFSAMTTSAQEDDLTEVTLFVGYIPSVQFAPLYVAIENGYFEAEGIDLEIEYSFNEADGLNRIALNDLQFGIISGEQVLIGRGADKPLVYVYEWFEQFPVGIVAPADSGIETPEDLRDKKVGIPGPFGASYMGLRALLSEFDMDELDLQLESIGFTAPEAVCTDLVEAAVVYIANEPLTIQENCFDVTVMFISDYVDLVSNGLVTNEETLENDPELVAGMVRALQMGVRDTIDDPEAAFDLSVPDYVPDLPEEEYDTQRQVLLNSIELWKAEQLGFSEPELWEQTQQILIDSGFMDEPLDDLEAAYTNEFLPEIEDNGTDS